MNNYANSFHLSLPPDEAAAHFYRLRKAKKPTAALELKAIADVENLSTAFQMLAREGGRAAGPDGVRFEDIGRSELYQILREVNQTILAGTYRPGQPREVKIPKGGNRGFRTLKVHNLFDRVVAKAVYEAMAPHLERLFLDGSHGFRPSRSNWTLLAQLEKRMVEEDRWVLVSDDVRNAFPSVRIVRAIQDHENVVGKKDLLELLACIIRGGDPARTLGLDQGCPYMPAALNVHLHYAYDIHADWLGADSEAPTPWFRYADNLVSACKTMEDGTQVLSSMAEKLGAVGLTLKGENDSRPIDLRRGGQSVQLLGFTLFRRRGELGIKLGDGAMEKLRADLLNAHLAGSPGEIARAVIDGWIESFGPAFAKQQDRMVGYIMHLAKSLGFRELAPEERYVNKCRDAYVRWRQLAGARNEPRIGNNRPNQRPLSPSA
jgi:hypothetical protein